ncbi:MAG: FUSC family protein, partial [Ferruginibacter sp.]
LRELLYKNRELIAESSTNGKLLILTFADLMELYEQITATWYDYESLREKFGHTGILENIGDTIRSIADELDNIGLAIQSNMAGKKEYKLATELEKIKAKIDALGNADPGNLVLKKILVNMRNMGRQVNELFNYFGGTKNISRNLQPENYYQNFVSHQPIDPSLFGNNLHLESSLFRHALRMTITCIAGFAIAKMISLGHHSYWILLTILVILKPSFGLSKERNIERILGTVGGGLIGLLILAFIHDRDILFSILVFCMVGTYTFQRVNYITMVIFMTPYILILFNLLGLPFWDIARERLLDTFIGGVLAFFASYLLFPQWESGQLQSYMTKVLKANIDYLRKVKDLMAGTIYVQLEYKLVRKELYVSIANLAAAFHRMLTDPRSKQQNRQQVDQFVVLNHIFSSNIVSLSAGVKENDQQHYSREILAKMKKAIQTMEETMVIIDAEYTPVNSAPLPAETTTNVKVTQAQLSNQLDFINKVATDINKITKQILDKEEVSKP